MQHSHFTKHGTKAKELLKNVYLRLFYLREMRIARKSFTHRFGRLASSAVRRKFCRLGRASKGSSWALLKCSRLKKCRMSLYLNRSARVAFYPPTLRDSPPPFCHLRISSHRNLNVVFSRLFRLLFALLPASCAVLCTLFAFQFRA